MTPTPPLPPGHPVFTLPWLRWLRWAPVAGQPERADCDGNISQTARLLGLDRRTLQRKLGKFPPHR